ncbi:MAG: DEAD/DEAH box helicase [Marinifilaceae bacterium]
MKAFETHEIITEEYKNYLESFVSIKDVKIREKVKDAFSNDKIMPEPLLQFNPSYATSAPLSELIEEGIVHPELSKVFGNYNLYHHQIEALRMGVKGQNFIVTSGTGSGKSLTFLATIFNDIFQNSDESGIKAILVYPMNALINSQEEEIKKYELTYLKNFLPAEQQNDPILKDEEKTLDEKLDWAKERTDKRFPVSFAKYTGQESSETKEKILKNPPDILLTNYMMLELIMTRYSEKAFRNSIKDKLKYLVFDELHTYRGRQGADVALLVRRIKGFVENSLIHIGTSATMATGKRSYQQEQVAIVAQKLFGDKFDKKQIICEQLQPCTKGNISELTSFDLQEGTYEINVNGEANAFVNHSLAIWLENRIALKVDEEGHIVRNTPLTLSKITEELANDAEISKEEASSALLKLLEWSENLNVVGAKKFPRESYLPFKIHQFIAQTGNVYVTLDAPDQRQIIFEDGLYADKNTPLFPLLFSRISGHEFLCVKKDFGTNRLLPRMPKELPTKITKDSLKKENNPGGKKRVLSEADFPMGYLIIPHDEKPIWDDSSKDILPESWIKKTKRGQANRELDNYWEVRLPSVIYTNRSGSFSDVPDEQHPLKAWFIPAHLLLDPTSGIIFDNKTNENTKLMRLGNEGRSTATTVLSFAILKAMHAQEIPVDKQKLLSFTDNRQDASLQAGHFNDYITLGRLRSAIYNALKKAPGKKLTIDNIALAVCEELELSEGEFARKISENPAWPDPKNVTALRKFILLKIIEDLKKGWRYTAANLEQSALLNINYNRLDEFCKQESFFEKLEYINAFTPAERQKIIVQVLNYFRTSYAIDYFLFDEAEKYELESSLRNALDDDKPWSLDKDEKIETPYFLISETIGETRRNVYTASIGAKSYVGKYLNHVLKSKGFDPQKPDALTELIQALCNVLVGGHFLSRKNIRGKSGETDGYRLRLDAIEWCLGDGKTVLRDQVRFWVPDKDTTTPNTYFKRFYQQDFSAFLKPFIGREHTGQQSNTQRIDREDKFRKGELSALYCSPTMELGIDIAELNIVHMRNVPPGPANYAQRSGRAGRSGQTALVFTYCTQLSPHDNNYFSKPEEMVAGSVAAPRIDLLNEELIATHFRASMLTRLDLDSLKFSITDVVDKSIHPLLPIVKRTENYINDQVQNFRSDYVIRFKDLLGNLYHELKSDTNWFTDEWLTSKANEFYKDFNSSFDRWRSLYLDAEDLVQRAHIKLNDPIAKKDATAKKEAKREYAIGLRQKELLTNEMTRNGGQQSEFYVFRYLASEGFLPGYNFTRMPIRTFVGYRHKEEGDFISRPRFIALKEFGPQNLIYHNGSKYRINRMRVNVADTNNVMRFAKICKGTGYIFLDEEARGINHDPITNQVLQGTDVVDTKTNLIEQAECEAIPRERISSAEEERMSTGYKIEKYFSVPQGMEHTTQTVIKAGDQALLNLTYANAAQLVQLNVGWRHQQENDGYALGRVSGKWKSQKEKEENDASDPVDMVELFTTDTADVLYIQPVEQLNIDKEGVITLVYALKRAIEKVFQIEESEVGAWLMGADENPNILIYEAAEGSLGILKSLTNDTLKLKEVFSEAYRICKFDPDTYEDLDPNGPKATYQDLLSYYNQRHHLDIDRRSVKNALEYLMDCNVDNTRTEDDSYESHHKRLLNEYDLNSATEKPFIDFLYQNGIRLPDVAQYNLPEHYVSADFVYKEENAIVFCDGSVHDRKDVAEEDRKKRQALINAGYDVIVWHYKEPIKELVERRKDIFRKIR